MAAGVAVGLVAINLGAVWFLRDRMTSPPDMSEVGPAATLAPRVEEDPPPFVGPVLLAGASDGSVLRLTRGGCEDGAAAAWVAPPDASAVETEIPGLVQSLAVGSDEDGWYVVGADADCEVQAWTGPLDGTKWTTASVPPVWHLLPGDDVHEVMSPKGPVPVADECTPSWVQAEAGSAYVTCAEGDAYRTSVAERTFVPFQVNAGLGGMAVRSDGRVATIAETPTCAADLKVFDDEETYPGKCFGQSRSGLGVAWVGDHLVAQVGYDLVEQAGATWTVRE